MPRLLAAEHQLQEETLLAFAQGQTRELVRPERLIRPHEMPLWDASRLIAAALFPKA